MRIDELSLDATNLPGAAPVFCATRGPDDLRGIVERARAQKARLVALWGSDETPRGEGYALHLALALKSGLLWLSVPLSREHPRYRGIADIYPCANRMQRATWDMLGIHARQDADPRADHRKWLRHGAWPGDIHPLRKDFDGSAHFDQAGDRYAFVKVEGDGVHEIPVGPVHAGTIEPGHFRFSIVGEKVLRLEQRLGYKHKGIEKRFENMSIEEGARLAGRISGDSTVAYAWAYAMAVEGAGSIEPPPRALCLRAVFLELERIANHLGDLGYLGNDVALAFGFFQFWRLKEDLLRAHGALFGHRYLMDLVVPGGVAHDLSREGAAQLSARLDEIEAETAVLKSIYEEHAGVQDRFIMTGQVLPELAERLCLNGPAGRASGMACDLRVDHPVPPYEEIEVRKSGHRRGDVAARVSVRFDELVESMRLVRVLLESLPPGEIRVQTGFAPAGAKGAGWIEGWRGEVLIALDLAADNRIHRLHPHDPSWQNWPALEHAVLGNIVPDFPLINKSFNLSYSGQDL